MKCWNQVSIRRNGRRKFLNIPILMKSVTAGNVLIWTAEKFIQRLTGSPGVLLYWTDIVLCTVMLKTELSRKNWSRRCLKFAVGSKVHRKFAFINIATPVPALLVVSKLNCGCASAIYEIGFQNWYFLKCCIALMLPVTNLVFAGKSLCAPIPSYGQRFCQLNKFTSALISIESTFFA